MVASCSAYNCQERYVKGGDITFHSFPKNEELKKKWVLLTRRQNFTPTQASKLCSKHFTSDCFDNESQCQSTTIRKKTKLKQDAVPSIFHFPRFVNTLKNKRKLPQQRASPPAGQEKGWPPINKEHSKVWLINFRKDDWKSSQLSQTCPQHLTTSNFIFCPDPNVKRLTTENVSAVLNFPALLNERTNFTHQDLPKEIPSPPDNVKGDSQPEVCRLCMGQQNKMMNLYGGEDATNSDLISRIMKCASIEVFKDDGLPPLVCERCLEKVNASYDFRLQCESSDSILRQQLVLLSTTVSPNKSIMIKDEPVSLEEVKDTIEGPGSPFHKDYFKEEEFDQTDDNVDNDYSLSAYSNDNVDIDYSPSVSYNDDMDANYDPNDEQETLKCEESAERFSRTTVCRLKCANYFVFGPGYQGRRSAASSVLTILCLVQVFKDDGLPPQVCERCLEKVNASYDFRLQCESSDSILRQQLVLLSTTVSPDETVVIKNEPFSAEELEDPGGDFEDCNHLLHMLSRANKRRLCDPTNVKALRSKEMGLLNAAKQYHVPRTSLTRICSVLKDDTNVTVEDPIHPRLGRTSSEFHMKNSLKFYNILETEYKKNNLSPDGVYTVLSLEFTILHKDSQKVSLLRKECQILQREKLHPQDQVLQPPEDII
uniref:ZAD domain-containing protein n=1 Tax=Timema tahoe TaxID=61484 RepID=A0A7R9IMB2_9NEOP|nr:unnamed protein product [Timema tahoe]